MYNVKFISGILEYVILKIFIKLSNFEFKLIVEFKVSIFVSKDSQLIKNSRKKQSICFMIFHRIQFTCWRTTFPLIPITTWNINSWNHCSGYSNPSSVKTKPKTLYSVSFDKTVKDLPAHMVAMYRCTYGCYALMLFFVNRLFLIFNFQIVKIISSY